MSIAGWILEVRRSSTAKAVLVGLLAGALLLGVGAAFAVNGDRQKPAHSTMGSREMEMVGSGPMDDGMARMDQGEASEQAEESPEMSKENDRNRRAGMMDGADMTQMMERIESHGHMSQMMGNGKTGGSTGGDVMHGTGMGGGMMGDSSRGGDVMGGSDMMDGSNMEDMMSMMERATRTGSMGGGITDG